MKVDIQVLLSEDEIASLDARLGPQRDRSAYIEEAMQRFLARDREGETARDIEIIEKNATRLNEEAADVLDYAHYPH